MKKSSLFISGLLLCAVAFSGCDKNKVDPPKNTLSVSGATNSAIVFAAEDNDDVTLTVATDASEWDYTVPGWVDAVKSGNTLVVSVADNTGVKLEGTIVFTAGTADAVSISVSQAEKKTAVNTLSVTGATDFTLTFEAEDNDDVTLTVATDASEWDYTVPGWVNAVKSGNTLVVSVADNTGGQLEGSIVFTAGTAEAVDINVIQKAASGHTDQIAIDGYFSDWAGIPVAKVGVGNMKEAKYYSDGTNLFMYFKADKSALAMSWDNLQVFFDTDNDNTTGANMAYAFGDDAQASGMEYALELNIANGDGLAVPIGRWSGSVYIDLPTWSSVPDTGNISGENITDCVNGLGAVNGDFYEVEVKVSVGKLPWSLANKFRIAARIGSSEANYIPIYTWPLDGSDGDGDGDEDGDEDGVITINGVFTDWAGIEPVAGSGKVIHTKYYSDGTDIFMYLKATEDVLTGGWQHFEIFFDSDNDNTTGTTMGYAFGNDGNANGMDYLLKPDIHDLTRPIGSQSAGNIMYQYASRSGMTGDYSDISGANVVNCVHGVGAVNGDHYELEIRIAQALLPWEIANPFRIAVLFETGGYSSVYGWTWK